MFGAMKKTFLSFQNIDEFPPPSLSEVDIAIERLKNNKSSGSDGQCM